jgi:beta-phosphoglucomutase-like phosphatase (HAD superfamily)
MPSAVFFDLDETLIDADGCHREASRRAFAAFGMDWDAALTRTGPFFGRRMREILEARRDALGVDESTAPVDALLALRWEHYVDLFPAGVGLLPGASEAVASVSDHAAVAAIVASSARATIALTMEHHGLSRLVSFVIGGDDVTRASRTRNATRSRTIASSPSGRRRSTTVWSLRTRPSASPPLARLGSRCV